MAHKKGAGSTKNGRDSNSKRLGIKAIGGQFVKIGQIILRQRGYSFKAGNNVGIGKDYTLYALKDGYVSYNTKVANKNVSIKLDPWETSITVIGYPSWSSFLKRQETMV